MESVNLDPTQTAQTATPSPAPVSTPDSTVIPQSGQSNIQGEPADVDTFTKVDVNTLNAKDREAYNNMLRDYKAKTTELASQRKQFEGINIEELRQKASLYEQILQQQQASKNQEADESMQTQLAQLWQEAQTDPQKAIEFHRQVAQLEVQKVQETVQQMQQEKLEAEASTFVESFATATDPKSGEPLRPEYDAINESGLLRHEFDQLIADKPDLPTKEWPKTVETAYANAKAKYDAIYQKGFQAALAKHQAKIEGSTEMPTGSSVSNEMVMSRKDYSNLSTREIVELSRQGKKLRVR